METTDENIRQLLEMLDNPDNYTEQEICEIINRNEDARDTYLLMVEAKRSSRHRKDNKPVDVDAAWHRFNLKIQSKQRGLSWMKTAASFIGVLLMSGIALAAIHLVQRYKTAEASTTELTDDVKSPVDAVAVDTLKTDTTTVQPVVYDNIPLENLLTEIAAHYNAKVTFVNEEARQFRFRFVWNPQQGIDQVVSDLNQFERLTVMLKDNVITVE